MPDIVKGLLVIAFLIMLLMVPNIKLVQTNKALVVERLGRFLKIVDHPGIYITIPLIDRVVEIVPLDIQEKTFTIKKIDETTEYRIYMKYRVINIKLFVYAALDSIQTIKEYIRDHTEISDLFTKDEEHLIREYADNLGVEIIELCAK